jgi:DNA-binding response OmpR family regulator
MPRILVIDDDDKVRAAVKWAMKDFEVIETADATEALGLALETRPECILLDLNLPMFSGLELCQTLMSVSITQTIPVFLMSDNLGPDYQERYRHLGATAFFEKPLDFSRLRKSLTSILQGPGRVPRSEPRIRLKAALRLRGTAENGKEFDLLTTTEDVSGNGFCCRCAIPVRDNDTVEVSLLTQDSEHEVGTARLRHTAWRDQPWQACGFQFISKRGPWIL